MSTPVLRRVVVRGQVPSQLERSLTPALFFFEPCYFRIGGKDCDVPSCRGRRDFPARCSAALQSSLVFMRSPNLMTEPRFKIGQSVFYRAERVKEGPFRVLAVLPQRRDKARYRVRRKDDETVEYVVDESELSIS